MNCQPAKMRLFIIFIILFASGFAYGQDSLQLFELAELVVTGEVDAQSAKQSVYQVRTIPMERIQAQGATRLEDILTTDLNMQFSQDPALGESNFDMLGLSGQNIKILIDGVPMIGRQGVKNEININQINVSSIERIEIVEGPMSVIYGADALAGVINIITKKSPEGKLDISATIHEESIGSEYGVSKGIHNENVNFGYNTGSFYFSGNVNRNDFQGTTGDSVDRKMQWLPKMQWLAGGVVGYQTDKWNVYYRADYLHETIYSPDKFSGNQAIDRNFITKRLMHQLQLRTSISEKLNFHAAISYTGFKKRTQAIVVDKPSGKETLAFSELQKRNSFSGVTLRGTFNYAISDAVTLQPGYDINIEQGSGERLQDGDNMIADYAVFMSADLKVTPFISLRPGLRVVRNTSYEAPPVIPSLNTKFTLSDKHNIRLSYGRGFRAPSIRELYFDFIDASHSIEGNPDLEAELSHSVNASWNAQLIASGFWNLTSSLSGFYNSIENRIQYGNRPDGSVTYINVDHFKSKGFAFSHTLRRKQTTLKLGFAYTGRYNEYLEEDKTLPEFTWSPEINGSFTHVFPKPRLTVSLFYKYTGKRPMYVLSKDKVVLSETSGFHWADLTMQKTIMKNLRVTVGVRNLFDATRASIAGAETESAHGRSGDAKTIGYGRSYFMSVQFNFTR